MAQVGGDFDVEVLQALPVDMAGVAALPGTSATFAIDQSGDGRLSFSDKGCLAQVSVDMFEPFVAAEPDACRKACDRADLIFLNEAEYRGLYDGPQPSVPTILKRGPAGVEFLADSARQHIPAPPADEVDSVGAGEILAGAFLALPLSCAASGRN